MAPNIEKIEDRLRIYQEVLNYLESNTIHPIWETNISTGLCILLPCAWNNVNWKLNFQNTKGEVFWHNESFDYFPEIQEYYWQSGVGKGCIKYHELYIQQPIEWRKKILKEIILNHK